MPLPDTHPAKQLLRALGHSDELIDSDQIAGKFGGQDPVFTPVRSYTTQEIADIEAAYQELEGD